MLIAFIYTKYIYYNAPKREKHIKTHTIMCTVTLEYDQSSALARRKMAALLATGLFTRVGAQDSKPTQVEIQQEREETQAFFECSKRSMSEFIARNV